MSGPGLLVHEWIERIGGAERVLDEFAGMHPDADVLALWNDDTGRYGDRVQESLFAATPLRRHKAAALPLMPAVWARAAKRLGAHDWALVSSHLFAHQVIVPGVAPERQYTYVHTPARYLWSPELDHRGRSLPVRLVAPPLRRLDRRRAQRLRNVAVNSAFVQERVRQAWGVESVVIHPPVDVARVRRAVSSPELLTDGEQTVLDGLPEGFVLGASRFVPYKELETVIALGAAADRPVVLAGRGPDEARLRAVAARAAVEVTFVIAPTDAMLAHLLGRAAVFAFPGIEDFGIVPVEAMALGTPVIASVHGGARDTVGALTGVHLSSTEPDELRAAVDRAVLLDPEDCRTAADGFASGRFRREVRAWMQS
ncbi:glycosyltransferase [Curtobacterium sp. L1-20]|uniref:glycosyltransferase n=1 Tax=Curtobacterium sp. L1-20 TaxID=3138181 RepID=UPI003B528C66